MTRPTVQRGLWFDELVLGLVIRHRVTRTITEADNVWFSCITMNPQPLHLDAEYAARTEYGQRLVNSLLTVATLVGLTVADTTLGTTAGNLGFAEMEFPRPMFHGDTLRAETEVVATRLSRTRSDRGIVTFEHRGFNQRDELVARAVRNAMMLCLPEPGRRG
jgi:acyl dehydratase